MRLLWIRHGETRWNQEFRLQGISDIELNDHGLEQSRRLARNLCEKPSRLFVSPLQRARGFALPLAERFGLSPQVLEPLRELSFGQWEGLRYEDMNEEQKREFEAWRADPARVCPPGGESILSLAVRVREAVDVMTGQMDAGETAAVVTHGGVIRTAVTVLMGMPPEAAARISIDPASLTVTDFISGHWRLVRANDRAHLREDC
jgi:broad specificity phosphatase PhoE